MSVLSFIRNLPTICDLEIELDCIRRENTALKKTLVEVNDFTRMVAVHLNNKPIGDDFTDYQKARFYDEIRHTLFPEVNQAA